MISEGGARAFTLSIVWASQELEGWHVPRVACSDPGHLLGPLPGCPSSTFHRGLLRSLDLEFILRVMGRVWRTVGKVEICSGFGCRNRPCHCVEQYSGPPPCSALTLLPGSSWCHPTHDRWSQSLPSVFFLCPGGCLRALCCSRPLPQSLGQGWQNRHLGIFVEGLQRH